MHRSDDAMDATLTRRPRIGWPVALACTLALVPAHASRAAGDWALCAPPALPPPPSADLRTSTIEADSASLREDGVSVVEGNVSLRTPGRTITSDRMNYDADAGTRGGERAGHGARTRCVPRRQPSEGELRDRRDAARRRDIPPPGLAWPGRCETHRERPPAHDHHRGFVHHLRPRFERVATRGELARARSQNGNRHRPARAPAVVRASGPVHPLDFVPPRRSTQVGSAPPLVRELEQRRNEPDPARLPQPRSQLRRHPPAATHEPAWRSARGAVPLPQRARGRDHRGRSPARGSDHGRLALVRFLPTPAPVRTGTRLPGGVRARVRHRLPERSPERGRGHQRRPPAAIRRARVRAPRPSTRSPGRGLPGTRRDERPARSVPVRSAARPGIARAGAQPAHQLRLSRRADPIRAPYGRGRRAGRGSICVHPRSCRSAPRSATWSRGPPCTTPDTSSTTWPRTSRSPHPG